MKNKTQRQYLKAKEQYNKTLKNAQWGKLPEAEEQLYKAEEDLALWALTRKKSKFDLTKFRDSWAKHADELIQLALKMR